MRFAALPCPENNSATSDGQYAMGVRNDPLLRQKKTDYWLEVT